MTPIKEIGECLITLGDEEYFFRPSLLNMTRIGSPEEIVEAFYEVHREPALAIINRAVNAFGSLPTVIASYALRPELRKRKLIAAMSIIQACCDRDVTGLTGEVVPARSGRRAFLYRPGALSFEDMLLISQSLITHGIIGKAKVRRLQKHEGSGTSSEFNAFEYISAARAHLGMSREEAEQLTMTDFQMMLSAKYPEQKGFTREEYDSVADDYMARKAKRIAKAA
ncbi:hypothetical protein H2241_17865 [Pantoea ananatis]|uniref:DUF6246 family protein n=1 Tax=Pantoea ananas TaxID=553 RepID=UPI0015891265|nr:DUF6246 family protein [Pantoea ananatis]MBA4822816.1 hypothetical protein [Pantoea ananatis]QKV87609.1 hypothetical protein FOB88_10940 [Pantoea ananatis]